MNPAPIDPSAPICPLEIVVVENHPDTLKYLGLYLRQSGHSARTARTVAEGLAALAEAPCDMLICDIGLPDGSGWDLIENARLPSTVYAVAMSGFGMGSDRHRSLSLGYRRHVLKPFLPEDLDVFIEEAQRERLARTLNQSPEGI